MYILPSRKANIIALEFLLEMYLLAVMSQQNKILYLAMTFFSSIALCLQKNPVLEAYYLYVWDSCISTLCVGVYKMC